MNFQQVVARWNAEGLLGSQGRKLADWWSACGSMSAEYHRLSCESRVKRANRRDSDYD